MKDFSISVTKLTDSNLMRQACGMTFLGKSKQSLHSIYKSEHSPARTQLFWIEAKGIPLFVSTHLIRHHVGSIPYQLTCRDDRSGGNPGLMARADKMAWKLRELRDEGCQDKSAFSEIIRELEWFKGNADRYTPVNLGILINAQSLIDMAKLRLCMQAHKETIQVFKAIKSELHKIDPDLANFMVKKCVYRGGICGEPKCCGYNATQKFNEELSKYKLLF
jgi:hypothetical protein